MSHRYAKALRAELFPMDQVQAVNTGNAYGVRSRMSRGAFLRGTTEYSARRIQKMWKMIDGKDVIMILHQPVLKDRCPRQVYQLIKRGQL